MLKKLSTISIFIMVVFLIAGSTFAGETLDTTGKVKDVDLDEKSIVVGTQDGDKVFYIENNSQIKQGGQTKTLKDISIGMVVEIKYQQSGDDNIVEVINIT